MEIGVGEEEEGDFERGVFGGEVEEFGRVGMGIAGMGNGAVEEVDVIEFVGGGDGGEGMGLWREDPWGKEEEDWEGEKEREG